MGPYGGGTGGNNANLPFYGLSAVFRVGQGPPTVVPADWSLIPSGLGAGDEFRLLFLSSTKRSIRSTNISDYNTFVQNRAAAGHTDIQDYSDTFRVLGSTGAKDARDNTGTTYTSSDKGVSIYWLNGDKAADEYQDFYDGSWDQQADAWNESGVEYDLSARRYVATGSSRDGTTEQSNPLGASSGEVQLGCLYQTSSVNGPVFCRFTTENITADDNQQLYGLSGVFQVTSNNPASGAPTISGTLEVRQTLTADISGIMDEDGLPFLVQFSYQWIRSDGTTDSDISGATDSTYKLEDADQGKTIKVRVTFTDEGGTEETLTSDATTAVAADTTGPVVEEVTCFDSLCNLVFDELLDENLNNVPLTIAFAITADGVAITVGIAFPLIDGQFQVSSLAPQIRQGQTVKVVYTDPTSGDDTKAIQDAAGNDAADFTTGEDDVPDVTNDSTLAPVAPDAPTGLTATASGATQIDLAWTAPADNGGRVITGYQIEYSDDGGTSWSVLVADTQSTDTLYSDTTLSGGETRHYRVSAINSIGTGAASNSPPTGKPIITGTPEVKQTLTADISGIVDTDGLPADDQFSYQWVQNDGTDDSDISGATDSTYLLKAADLGKTIKVRVTFTDEGGTEETLTSDATTAVARHHRADLDEGRGKPDWRPQSNSSSTRISTGTRREPAPVRRLHCDRRRGRRYGRYSVCVRSFGFHLVRGFPQDPAGQTVTVTYTDPTAGDDTAAIQDEAGNDAADFTTGEDDVPAVTNDSAFDTTEPILTKAVVNRTGTSIELVFDENLDRDAENLPQSGALTVTADEVAVVVGTVFASGPSDSISFVVSPKIQRGQTVTVTYTDPTAGDDTAAIQDEAGNDAADFTTGEDDVPAVTNDSTVAPPPLVSNIGQTAATGAANVSTTQSSAQGFTTGTNSGGYTLDSVELAVTPFDGTASDITVSIYSESSGDPGTLVHTLTTPGSLSDPVTTFTAPSGATLAASTTYYVVASTASTLFLLSRTEATAEDTGGASGWSIADDRRFSRNLVTWTTATVPIRMRINGAAATATTSTITEVPADWSLVPSGLQEGDQFRLLFISSAHRNASPSEIATYNTWIQARAANGHTDIQDYSSSFRAVGSTEDMDARDNTGTTYTSSDKGVAIYWLNGNKVADDYEDFYDEDWDEEASMKNESGTAESGVSAWTGSDHDGTEMLQGTPETSRALGNSNNAWVRFGKTDSDSHGPLSGATANRTGNKRIYGLSGVFEVVAGNNPATGTVTSGSITQTTAVITVTIANPDTNSQTVNLQYKRNADTAWTDVSPKSTVSAAVTFTLTGLTGNTEYDVRASLDSAFMSGVKTATFTTSPTKPGKTRFVEVATSGNGTLFITWQEPDSDGGSAITGYTVQWKSGSQSFGGDPSREHTTEDTFPDYLITGLTNGTEYTVRVIAVNAVGDGPPSDTDTGTPVGPPDAPPNVQAGSGYQQLTVSWGAPNDGGSAITEYTLQWKSGGQNFISSRQRTIAATSRTDTIPSLDNGTEYTVRVRATTALGDSGWSAEAKGTPREGPHVSLVKVKEPISCTVTFVALEFVNLDSATEYQAHLRFRAQGSSNWTVLSPQGFWSSGIPGGAARGELNGPSPAFTLTDLAYETIYEVQAALDSGFVDGLATTTFSTPNLSEAGLMPLSPGDGTLGLRMTRPTSEGRVDGYLLQWKSGDEEYDDKDTSQRQADVPGSGDREYTITGLDNGVEYTVRAMAYNDNGVGVPSSEVRGTPEAPPNSPARGAPTISGTAQVGETLTADTGGIEDDDGLADAVYSYQWLADDADIAGATSDTYTPVADDVGKAIKVKVSFRDDRNHQESLTSAATAAVEADPDAPTEPPNAPRTVRIVGDTNTSLTLTWDAPDGGTAVTEYRVQWLTVGEGFANARRDGREAVVDASARSHTITGLTKYGFYQVRVLAVNGAGESERSNTAWGFPGLGEGQYGHG